MEIKKCGTKYYKNESGGTPTVKENTKKEYYNVFVLLIG
jgi:hypothetical protein